MYFRFIRRQKSGEFINTLLGNNLEIINFAVWKSYILKQKD